MKLQWHKKIREFFNKKNYKKFLCDIGYIVKENEDFKITTTNIDEEISSIQYN